MAFFEQRCEAHRVELSFADIKRQCLWKSPTFKLLEPYIDKTGGLEEFINLQECNNVGEEDCRVVEACEGRDSPWDGARSDSLDFLMQDEPTERSSVSS